MTVNKSKTILEQVFRLKLCTLVLNTFHVILGQTRLLSISNKSCYFCPLWTLSKPYFSNLLNLVNAWQTTVINEVCSLCSTYIKLFSVFSPVQLQLYQFKLFCPSSKTNCSKVKIELQHIHCNGSKQQDMGTHGVVQSIQLLSI